MAITQPELGGLTGKGTMFVQRGQFKAVSGGLNRRIVTAAVRDAKGGHDAVGRRRWGTVGIQQAF